MMPLVSVLGCGTWLFLIEEQLYLEGVKQRIQNNKPTAFTDRVPQVFKQHRRAQVKLRLA